MNSTGWRGEVPEQTAALSDRVNGLQHQAEQTAARTASLAALEQRVGQLQPLAGSVQALSDQFEVLSGQVSSLTQLAQKGRTTVKN